LPNQKLGSFDLKGNAVPEKIKKLSLMIPFRLVVLAVLLATATETLTAADNDSPEALIETEHWKRARDIVEPRLKSDPNNLQALFIMARYKEAAGKFEAALALTEKLLALDPKNADYHCLLAYVYGRQVVRAGLFRKLGLARRIKKEAETALRLNPKHVEARLILIEYYRLAPGIVGGDKKKARAMAEEVVRFDPVRGYIAQANFAHQEEKTGQMEELYKKAVEANPQSYHALMTLARFYTYGSQRNFEFAEKNAAEAMRLDPGRAAAYSLLAQSFARQERWQELDDLLDQAEKNVPDNLNPYFQAGRVVYQQAKDFARAEGYFHKYLTQEPEPTSASHAQAYWRLGQTLEKMNRKAEAVEVIKTALKLDPGLESAKKDLKRLR
jgi:tetratricopeptide (TPR) repeat protein